MTQASCLPRVRDYELLADSLRAFASAEMELVRRARSLCIDREERDALIRIASTFGQTRALRSFIEQGFDPMANFGLGLVLACAGGHRDAAAVLLEAGVRADVLDGEAMVAAAGSGCRGVVELLLSHECPADAQGQAPLLNALNTGNREIAELLLAHGAQLAGLDAEMVRQACTLGGARTVECLSLLRDRGVDLGAMQTVALQKSAWAGDLVTTRYLLELGADPVCDEGAALVCAAASDNSEALTLLIDAAVRKQTLLYRHLQQLAAKGYQSEAWLLESDVLSRGYVLTDLAA